ncbi:MAG: AMP-binding protein [Sphingomonadales bacterium]|nr:AMP-binding protein [Sphingomonadales bacterium]
MTRLPQQIFTVPLFIESHASWAADKTAVIAGSERRTYGELNCAINRVGNVLIAMGLKRGDRVGLFTTNRIEHLEFAFGALKAGFVVAPISMLLTPETVFRLLRDAEVKALLVEAGSPLLDTDLPSRLPSLLSHGLIVLDDDKRTYAALLDRGQETAPPVQIDPEDDCTIIYSSGTTGVPKGILHSHMGRSLFGVAFAAEYAMNEKTVSVLTTPACSNASWMLMVPTFYARGTLIFMQGFEARSYLAAVETFGGTHSFLVPTQIEAVLDYPDLGRFDCRTLKTVISAGSKLRDETKRRLSTFTGAGFFEIYGTTEGAGTLLKPCHLPEKLSSVGPPGACGEIRIIGPDDRELPPNTRGEIVGRNLFCSRGYLNRPDQNDELAWYDLGGRLFFRTGDIGYLDEDGFLYVVDRKKDMIVSGGMNVYASDVEEVLAQHPDVLGAAVVAAPHDKWGETPHAFVELREGAKIQAAVLRDWANERLNRHERLDAVTLIDSLPRNTLQKVIKAELKARLWPRD